MKGDDNMKFMVERFLKADDNRERKNLLKVMKHEEVMELLDLIEGIDNLLEEIYG